MLVGGVIDDELGDHPDVAPVRLRDEPIEVLQGPVVGMDVLVIRDVVPIVAERRGVEGEQPQRIDAEPMQVVELLGEAGEVPDAVVVAVEEGAHVRLIDDGVLVPERVLGEHIHNFNANSQPPTPNDAFYPAASKRFPWELEVGSWELS